MDGWMDGPLTSEHQQGQRDQQQQRQMLRCRRHPGRREEKLAAQNKQQTTHMDTGELEAQDGTGWDLLYCRPSQDATVGPDLEADVWRLLPENGWSVGVVSSCSYCALLSGWVLWSRWFRSPRPATAAPEGRSRSLSLHGPARLRLCSVTTGTNLPPVSGFRPLVSPGGTFVPHSIYSSLVKELHNRDTCTCQCWCLGCSLNSTDDD